MADRKNTPFTNEHFIAFCEKMLGQPYWYGTVAYKCTESVRASKAAQYPSHYGASRTARYKQDIAAKKVCADCIGGAKGYAWTGGGIGVVESIGTNKTFTSRYASNGCPDKGANSMFPYAKSKGMDWGSIGTLPELVGLALHMDGHVGYYAGNGYAIEWKGYAYGCVKTKVAGRGWTHWYKLPFIEYAAGGAVEAPSASSATLGSRLLKRGMSGADVKALQELLMQIGHNLPKFGADSHYGEETEVAVKAFQKAAGLDIDGKYGDTTHATLMAVIGDKDTGKQDEPVVEDTPVSEPAPSEVKRSVVIVSDGGKVNIRAGNGAGYERITTVAPGTTFAYIASAQNGWHAIALGAQVGWVSEQFSKVL